MSIQEVAPEQLAELFHLYHQALEADLGGKDDPTVESWNDLPEREKSQAIAAARLTLLELASTRKEAERKYFAKPGEAEWGC